MELMTSVRFFKMVETLSPVEVLRLKLAARSGSSMIPAGVPPPYPADNAHGRDVLLPDGAGSGHGGRGEPGTVGCAGVLPAHETAPPCP